MRPPGWVARVRSRWARESGPFRRRAWWAGVGCRSWCLLSLAESEPARASSSKSESETSSAVLSGLSEEARGASKHRVSCALTLVAHPQAITIATTRHHARARAWRIASIGARVHEVVWRRFMDCGLGWVRDARGIGNTGPFSQSDGAESAKSIFREFFRSAWRDAHGRRGSSRFATVKILG